jgi:hypothetical protein
MTSLMDAKWRQPTADAILHIRRKKTNVKTVHTVSIFFHIRSFTGLMAGYAFVKK